MYFDRFDICEAWNVWAHDYGEYETITRLDRMGFSAGTIRETYEVLTENGRAIYDALVTKDNTL